MGWWIGIGGACEVCVSLCVCVCGMKYEGVCGVHMCACRGWWVGMQGYVYGCVCMYVYLFGVYKLIDML